MATFPKYGRFYNCVELSLFLYHFLDCFITMDVAFAIDTSAALSEDDFEKVKIFAKNLVHNFADAENSIHFGLVQYSGNAEKVVDFNKYISDPIIKPVIQGLAKSSDGQRRVDLALETIKKEVFR